MMARYILTILFFLSQYILAAQTNGCDKMNPTDSVIIETNIYKTILSGAEGKVRSCFKEVSLGELNGYGSAETVKALNKLSTKNKVSHTIWILEETRNRSVEIRSQVYSDLLKVNYTKPNFFLKQMINNYFTNYKEPDESLALQVNLLHRRMVK